MVKKINALINDLENVCDEFNFITDAESNWHVACAAAVYADHVKRGIEGLNEMINYLSQLSEWRLNQLQEEYHAE